MLSRRNLVLTSVVSLGLFLGGCSDENPVQSSDEQTGAPDEVMEYTISGDNLIFSSEQTVYTYSYCNGDSLVSEADTSEASLDTIPFSVSGNTLKIAFDEAYFDEAETILVTIWGSFSRTGSGSGIEGKWSFSDVEYTVTEGSLTEDEKEEVEALLFLYRAEMNMDVEISNGQIKIYYLDSDDTAAADMFIMEWNGEYYDDPSYSDSAEYDITVTKVDASTVQLKGNKTGETVTIALSKEKETYSSSDPENETGTYYDEPVTCPNEVPGWYYDFLYNNRKEGSAKTRAMTKTGPRVRSRLKQSRSLFAVK